MGHAAERTHIHRSANVDIPERLIEIATKLSRLGQKRGFGRAFPDHVVGVQNPQRLSKKRNPRISVVLLRTNTRSFPQPYAIMVSER